MRAPLSRVLWTVVVSLVACNAMVAPPRAQDPCVPAPRGEAVPGFVDRERGEEEIIRQREEWFYSARQSGTCESPAELRWKAVEYTRQQMKLQAERDAETGADQPVWVSRGPSSSEFGGWAFGKVSGRVVALAKDSSRNILYAGAASGGLWKSADDGRSWTSIFDNAGTVSVGAIAIDPGNPDVLYAGTGENSRYGTAQGCYQYWGIGLLVSADGGQTWQQLNGTQDHGLDGLHGFCAIIVDPRDTRHIVVGGSYRGCDGTGTTAYGGIFTSVDGGGTWSETLPDAVATDIVQDPQNRDVYWAGIAGGAGVGGVYKSVDNGGTWARQAAATLPGGGRIRLAISPANGQVVYALFGSQKELWRTTDGGGTWSKTSSDACDWQCDYNLVLRAHNTDPGTLYRGTVYVYKSTDGGANWTFLSGTSWGSAQKVHQDTQELLMDPGDPDAFYVGCDGGVWKSADGGSTLVNLNANLNVTQFYAVAVHPTDDGVILGGSQDNSSLARTSCDTWQVQKVTGDGMVPAVNPNQPDVVYVAGYPFSRDGSGGAGKYPAVYRSTSGLWGPFDFITGEDNGIPANERINWVTPYTLDPKNPAVMYLGTQRIFRSDSAGAWWDQVGPSDLSPGGGTVLSLAVSGVKGGPVFAGTTSSLVWRSPDGVHQWTAIQPHASAWGPINALAADPANTNRVLAATGNFSGGTLKENNGTVDDWRYIGAGLPEVPANAIAMVSSTEVYVGTDVGVFRSSDGGKNFSPFMRGFPEGLTVTDLKFNAATRTLTAGTFGRGAWQISLAVPGEAAGTPDTALKWAGGAKDRLTWGASAGVQGYRLYRGDAAEVSNLPKGASMCLAYEGAPADTGPTLGAVPPAGSFHWYLVTAYNANGEGTSGAGTSTPRVLKPAGPCAQ